MASDRRSNRAVARAAMCAALFGCSNVSGLDDLELTGSGGATSTTSSVTGTPASGGGGSGPSSSSGTASTTGTTTGSAGGGGTETTYAEEVLSDGPIAYWRLGEGNNAGTAIDTAGAFDAAYFGTLEWGVEGAISNDADTAIELTQTCPEGIAKKGVSLTDDKALALEFPGKASFTIEAWIRPSCIGSVYRRIVEKAEVGQAAAYGYTLHISPNDDKVVFKRVGLAGDDWVLGPDETSPQLDVWSHVVAVFDGETPSGNCRVFHNGVGGLPVTCNTDIPATTAPFQIGIASNTNHPFAGGIDEVAVYDKPLEAARINAHFLKGIAARR